MTRHKMRHGQHLLYKWTLLENSVAAHLSDDRRYLPHEPIFTGTLLCQVDHSSYLCYDYGYPCLPHILLSNDKRNAYPLCYICSYGTLRNEGFSKKKRHVLQALALGLVPFLPAAHILLPVGTPVGDYYYFTYRQMGSVLVSQHCVAI